jgi:glycosyltransferase involved in cell wall biosynthesis
MPCFGSHAQYYAANTLSEDLALRYLFDLTTSAQWSGPVVGIVRVERELARRARHHLGDALAFCIYDRSRNLVLAIDDATADGIIAGRLRIDLAPAPPLSRSAAVRPLRRLMLANVTIYHAVQRLRGRSFTREEILRIWAQERAAAAVRDDPDTQSLSLARVASNPAALDAKTCLISGGLDWQYKDLRGLWSLKQRHGFRYCTIVHDLIPLNFPHFVTAGYDAFLTDYFGELMWLADCAMCNSEATRRDWLAYCAGFDVTVPSHVFPLGSDLPSSGQGAEPALPDALQGKRFALFVSTIEPRKNHRVLYEAWDRCMRSRMLDPARDRLVFVGRRGWNTDDLLREIAANPATRDSILVLDHVSDAVLGALYRHCAFVLFPSFYEGYGIPVAEALNHGKPCISSNAGSLPEIGGDVVTRLDPKDTIAWSDAITRYLASPEALATWEQRIKTEYRPVTWDDAAKRFFGTVAEVVS